MKNTRLYMLDNSDYKLIDEVIIDNFKNARQFFKGRYRGKYEIHWFNNTGELQKKKVRL